MKRLSLIAASLLALLSLPSALAEEIARIALFGGSSSATTYLPAESKHHAQLTKALETAYPGQKVEVLNFADNGEFIARYLLKERYTAHLRRLAGKPIDIALVRTGINDSKRFNPEEYAAQLGRFIDLLEQDFPGVKVIVETGFYLDYPKHYSSDRNQLLNPYWQANRDVAKARNLPLSDVYETTRKATEAGDWDIRIRSQSEKNYPKKPGRIYWSTELDEEYGKNPAWFTDVHPNPHGVGLAVATEIELFKTLYPERLPAGTGKNAVTDPNRPLTFFVEWIDCTPERMELKKGTKNPDRLQTATPL